MEGYLLMFKDGNFICKNHSNKIYFSKIDIQNANFYLHLKNAENILKSERYWKYHNIDYTKLKPVKVKLIFNKI